MRVGSIKTAAFPHRPVVFVSGGDRLDMTRIVNGFSMKGTGRIEYALGADPVPVLWAGFRLDGADYETTCLWRSDLDNYARISGYLYRPGVETDSAGMEVLFIDHAQHRGGEQTRLRHRSGVAGQAGSSGSAAAQSDLRLHPFQRRFASLSATPIRCEQALVNRLKRDVNSHGTELAAQAG